ncbi:tannase/feruloyl esterase family alpha/beta hydrolase [Yoonia sp. R78084]|uniref:tannase/feruloyl esterase family alpha/beta hydrolase n=1 Tax=Yoonia sp. R78084 TaxID=3093869 RepID=UPI0037DCCAB0
MKKPNWNVSLATLTASVVIASTASGDELPTLGAASPSSLEVCETLAADFDFQNTVLTEVSRVAAAEGDPEYCLVTGEMNDRTGPIDGADYGSIFEMRLPTEWNGRFLYQANGGVDGNVADAVGRIGSPQETGLQKGFAVISSDAGHPTRSASFGVDPQARLDYGYQAVGYLTPMAKALIEAAYGRGPDRSYIGGSSNGGRHAMVAAARYGAQYDGFLALYPGVKLPRAALYQIWGAQQWDDVATEFATPTDPDTGLATALTGAERQVIADAMNGQCDALDGIEDGMILNTLACQDAFSPMRDIPVCEGNRDGTCLSVAQIDILQRVFAGGQTSDGRDIYSDWYFDSGIASQNWADWKFKYSTDNRRDAVALSYIFMTPPQPVQPDPESTYAFSTSQDIGAALDAIYASDETYTESAWEFMTPPDPTNLDTIRDRGAKLLVIHGVSDPVFSAKDTAAWFEELDAQYSGSAEELARFFLVPGMGHGTGGPSTSSYDGLDAIVAWVERGEAPDVIIAQPDARNADVPENWSATRSRPLCLYPASAFYTGGDIERAESFECR